MPYTVDDLSFFEPLRDTSPLEGTAHFELGAGSPPEPFACWLDNSLFVRDAAFDFFGEVFQAANEAFDYFAFERFYAGQVAALIQHLSAFIDGLTPECPREVVFGQYNSLFDQGVWRGVESEPLRRAVVSAGQGVVSFVRATPQQATVYSTHDG
jgi:hypothetical protein